MSNYRIFDWGKIANKLRLFCSQSLDDRPQLAPRSVHQPFHPVQNLLQLPVSSIGYARCFPLINLTVRSLLLGNFSPQSTPPITITTIIKFKER